MNIALTWPKSRSLGSYLGELDKAVKQGLQINFKVPTEPKADLAGGRCYMVWNGAIRGWNRIIECKWKWEVVNPITREWMSPGFFVVRDPQWTQIDAVPMVGFQGFRYLGEDDEDLSNRRRNEGKLP